MPSETTGALIAWESQRLPLIGSGSSIKMTGSSPTCASSSLDSNPVYWHPVPEPISLGHGRGQELHKASVLSGS